MQIIVFEEKNMFLLAARFKNAPAVRLQLATFGQEILPL